MRPRERCPRGHDNSQPGQRFPRGYCKACHVLAQSRYEKTRKGKRAHERYRSTAKGAKTRFYAVMRETARRHAAGRDTDH